MQLRRAVGKLKTCSRDPTIDDRGELPLVAIGKRHVEIHDIGRVLVSRGIERSDGPGAQDLQEAGSAKPWLRAHRAWASSGEYMSPKAAN